MPSMAWNQIVPPGLEGEFRRAVLLGITEAYNENCRRFAPEDIGDNNVNFSHNVRENLRYLVTRNIDVLSERHIELAGAVEVFWRGAIYEIRLPDNVRLHIYKAPPGTEDVRELRFKASKRQVEILEVNAAQLALRFDEVSSSTDLGTASTTAPVRHIVAFHFGDPVDGLDRVVVGEPYLSDLNAPDWMWIESLSDGTLLYERDEPNASEAIAEDIDDDFDDLEVRKRSPEEGEDDTSVGYSGP